MISLESLLTNPETAFVLKLLACLIAGVFIGRERERHGKSAGISTHTFVISGAMIFTTIAVTINNLAMVGSIVTGIGFLGAGIIMKQNDHKHIGKDTGKVINLTTAASIWFSAAIGILIGFSWFMLAGITSLFSVVILEFHELFGIKKE